MALSAVGRPTAKRTGIPTKLAVVVLVNKVARQASLTISRVKADIAVVCALVAGTLDDVVAHHARFAVGSRNAGVAVSLTRLARRTVQERAGLALRACLPVSAGQAVGLTGLALPLGVWEVSGCAYFAVQGVVGVGLASHTVL